MTGPVLLGALFGAGLIGVLSWLVPARPSLAQALAALHPLLAAPPAAPVVPTQATQGWVSRLGGPVVPLLARTGLPRSAALDNLTVCGQDPARHLAEQAAMALLAFLTVPALAGLLTSQA